MSRRTGPLRPCGAGRAARAVRADARPREERDGPDHDHRRRPGGTDRGRRLRGGRRGGRRARGAHDPRRPGPHDRGAWLAHEGPHALYADGPHWSWLAERDLVGPVATVPLREVPADLVPPRRAAPADATGECSRCSRTGAAARRSTSTSTRGPPRCTARRPRGPPRGLLGVVTFDSDPGRLSAAFVWDVLRRVTAPRAPAVRWVVGGWPVLVDRLAARARELGVRIETSSRVDVLPEPPVIVATQLESARALLGDETLAWESGRCVLLDVGFVSGRRDAFVVADLDDAGFVERVTAVDATLAPAGHALVQADMPLKPGEPAPRRSPAWSTCSTWGSRGGATAWCGAGPDSRRAAPAPWTCPGPHGGTGRRSTAATGSSWPVIWWPRRASARRSRSTARCTQRGWPRASCPRPCGETHKTFIEREPGARHYAHGRGGGAGSETDPAALERRCPNRHLTRPAGSPS